MQLPRPARVLAILVLLLAGPATTPAAALGFGKNKVVYERLDWSVLQTPHLRLHYYAAEESLARRLAVVAESVCVEYDARFRVSLRHEIPLLLFSAHQYFQQTNATPGFVSEGVGGLTELIKGRVMIPHTGSWARLTWVTRHELAHAYMLEKISRVLKEHKRTQGYLPPLWFIEGLAEYCGTTWDADAEGLLRDAVLSNEALPLTRSDAITGTVLMYKEGQSFLLWLASQYGPDKPFDLLDHWYQAQDFETLFRIQTGRKLRDADEAWFDSIRRRYYPMVVSTTPVKEVARHLPTRGRYALGPRVLPSAADSALRFCYFSADEQGIELRLSEPRAKGKRRDHRLLRSGENPTFESLHLFQNRPAVSASGLVALSSKRGGRDALYLIDSRDGRIVRRLQSDHLVGILDPAIVPGDSAVVFSAQDASGRMDLFRWTWPGGRSRLERLTDDEYDDIEPSISPDGRWVAFASDRDVPDGRHALHRLSLVDGHIERMSDPPSGSDRQPVYSPDGRWIAYRSTRAGTSDLWVRHAEPTSEARRVTRTRGPVLDPDWLPGGKGLLFVGQEAIEFQVYRVAFDPDTLPVERESAPVEVLASAGGAVAVPPDSARFAAPDSAHFAGLGHPPAAIPPAAVHKGPSLAYQRRLGLDLFANGFGYDPTFGGGGGSQIAFSDVLGNEQLLVTIANSGDRFGDFWDNWEGGLTYINMGRRLHYGLGVFRFTQTYDADLDQIVRERRIGVLGLVSYPFNKFVRVEGSVMARHSSERRLRNGEIRSLDLVTNSLALVHDDTHWTRVGPTRGSRWYMAGAYTRDLTSGQGDYGTLQAEYRAYLEPLRYVVMASRVVGRSSFGPDAPRSYLGGVYTLRGYSWQELGGLRTLSVQHEIRAPIIRNVVFNLPTTWELPTVSGAVFADGGWAWDRIGEQHLGSAGFGVMIGGGVFPSIRWNWAWKTADFRTFEPHSTRQFLIAYDF